MLLFAHFEAPLGAFVGFCCFVRYILGRGRSLRCNRFAESWPVNEDPGNTARPAKTEFAGRDGRTALTPAEAEFARELFELHRLALYRYLKRVLVSREDAREILQETYLRLLRQPSFEPIRQNARAYLFQTATNLAHDFFRRRSRKSIEAEAEVFATSGLASPQWSSWPEMALQAEQTQSLIIEALRELPAPVRTALLQHRFQDLTHWEIALRLGVSERTVERYIKDGLSHLAIRLEAQI
jgi:RNA polymerase sigma factor (sigma-70 family)